MIQDSDVVTRPEVVAALDALALADHEAVIVHASLSSFGWVCGGAQTIVQALIEAAGPACTLVFPTFTGDWTDPGGWRNPPIAPAAAAIIRVSMPPFDPYLSPTRGMGRIAECFRTHPAARRSAHPQVSLAAIGPAADAITAVHSVDHRFGERSPLAALDRMDSAILFLGTDFRRCTALHLAEYRSSYVGQARVRRPVPVRDGEAVRWEEVGDFALVEDDFPEIGAYCRSTVPYRELVVGRSACTIFPYSDVVAAATEWMNKRVIVDPKIVR